jgi:hypothetical protein
MSFLRPLTAGGAAVVAIDHAPKNAESPSLLGSQHKKAAVTGAMFRFQIQKPFGRGLRGVALLHLEKDKPGYLRQHAENNKGLIAELVLESLTDGTLNARLNTPSIGGERPTQIMAQLSIYAARHPEGITLGELKNKGTSSTYTKLVIKGIEILLEEGFLQRDKSGKYTCRRPYRPNAENNPYRQAQPVYSPLQAPVLAKPVIVPGQLLESPQLPIDELDDDNYFSEEALWDAAV